MTQDEISEIIDVSRQTYSAVEKKIENFNGLHLWLFCLFFTVKPTLVNPLNLLDFSGETEKYDYGEP